MTSTDGSRAGYYWTRCAPDRRAGTNARLLGLLASGERWTHWLSAAAHTAGTLASERRVEWRITRTLDRPGSASGYTPLRPSSPVVCPDRRPDRKTASYVDDVVLTSCLPVLTAVVYIRRSVVMARRLRCRTKRYNSASRLASTRGSSKVLIYRSTLLPRYPSGGLRGTIETPLVC